MAAARHIGVEIPKETTNDAWPKWKIGLAVGAPIAVVLGGLWYVRKRRQNQSQTKRDESKSKTQSTKAKAANPASQGSVPDKPEKELTPSEQAQAEKNKGNKYFKGGKYDQAINCYTNAIKICPPGDKEALSTFYHNRAAAYEKLKNTKMVIDDCNEALRLNPKYQKALTRRAIASEQSGDLTQALEDVTAVCILEGFQNPQSLMTADRVLKTLGQTKAKEAFKKRKPMIPSRQFIRTYLRSFQNDPVINAAKELQTQQNGHTEDGSPYQEALQKLATEEFEGIIDCCSKEIAANTNNLVEARLLRGTMYFLCNQQKEALEDFNQVLAAETLDKRVKVNALIKRGTLYIQQEKHTEGLDDFATAVRIDPDNVDVYHHRGHHNIQLDRMEDAIRDLENAISKSTTFAPSHVQKSFAEHKKATSQMAGMNLPLPQAVLQSYKQCVDMFPDYGEARALYAQALADAGKFEEADREFAKSLELEPDNATAVVHRGLLQLQWKQNIQEATTIINKAIELDPKCEYAYEVLGTLEVQKGPGSMEKAIELFQKAISLSKTESEMAHLFSLSDAAKAQLNVAKKLGINLPSLSAMNS
ncbi:mitochondrial import receptor subunit TOM70-like [Saccostrea echinata]|uniref:mitochondrial import receptor subunit TOM70-like n=1 Tax=Saccostrea echinata TaxID=191078 RepID=UPI002A7F3297|nr:mitochondrial import receptor subunit TOM70-like [Saccostrea echinata]